MIGNHPLLFVGNDLVLTLQTADNAVDRRQEILARHIFLIVTVRSTPPRCSNIGDVGTRKAGRLLWPGKYGPAPIELQRTVHVENLPRAPSRRAIPPPICRSNVRHASAPCPNIDPVWSPPGRSRPVGWKPSISVSNWLSVFSRSSLPENPAFLPRARPMASISSMKRIQELSVGLLERRRARAKRLMPRTSPRNPEPEIDRNGTLALSHTAFANRVLPVPGGPNSNAPWEFSHRWICICRGS